MRIPVQPMAEKKRLGALGRQLAAASLVSAALLSPAIQADQSGLDMEINKHGEKTLEFDWPILHVGTGEYPAGPTGVTVFHFQRKVLAAVDVSGGAPGTVNAEFLKLGYDLPELDSVVFSGGSWYGLETATAVATALKDDGIRDGYAFGENPNIALSVGSIVYDFGSRRLNEIYPDKRLAQAAFRAAEPGWFPQGAAGAGRMTLSGVFFGCNAHSGQGGAFRQLGDLKVAVFTVVNSLGVITDREGNTVACYPGENWPEDLRTADLMQDFPSSRAEGWAGVSADDRNKNHNTTVSLVVVNQKLPHAQLERLAKQVHASMSRGIQPFATQFDGDVLYAVSTGELEATADDAMSSADLGAVASEVMWDAILSSVPEQPQVVPAAEDVAVSAKDLRRYSGDYRFSRFVTLRVERRGDRLFARSIGERDTYSIGRDKAVELQPVSPTRFTVPGRFPLVLDFSREDQLLANPGKWQQLGSKI
ncbi:P1 family peptidase [Microbulbifer halophilus]|uniref:P1 family peptidase n=1 Tax=Microbulbifer halophilus TaxID=453963 RepID=A0ABW5EDJ5_9GAMM|nr:P1 family peptidase [Microbulbifer halophilus]MCW8126944.1 P1 family peptidase [Microbulbifer halophilus]